MGEGLRLHWVTEEFQLGSSTGAELQRSDKNGLKYIVMYHHNSLSVALQHFGVHVNPNGTSHE